MKSNAHILLVEDNADNIALMKHAIKKCNIDVDMEVARDGKQAYDYLFGEGEYADRDAAAAPPRLIILDLKMPRMSGLELLPILRENPLMRTIPIIISSTSISREDIVASYDLGVNSFIRKPIDSGEFTMVIENLMRYWLSLNVTVLDGAE